MKSASNQQMSFQPKHQNINSHVSDMGPSNHHSFIDPATYTQNGEFVFKIPPEAPVFEPTVEEFLDPLAYINKIRPVAERTGICKVKPPPEWHPPFAVDVDHFKFTPRIQKLNELDANTRVKLYFLDRLATYWNYSGVQIRIPAIEDKTVDMYSLYKLVELEGGFDKISAERKWPKIAARMGYVNEKTVAPLLRQHYKRLLMPYEKFEKSKILEQQQKSNESNDDKICAEKSNISGKNVDITSIKKELEGGMETNGKQRINGGRRCTRSNCNDSVTEILVSDTFKNPTMADKNKELQRLTFYGPGPKILGLNKSKVNISMKKNSTSDASFDLLADSACMVCNSGDSEENILLCDGCDDGYHTFCLVPALNSVPKGEWRCPKCIADVVSKANDTTFGFEQAEREYSLQQFGEMADQFKSNYFNMPVHMVPTEQVEQEYWKILSSMDSSVTVEYGADLHSMDHGSGFPTQMALKQSENENHYYKSYVESNWNLNNIPVLEGSVLGYINADISGMKVPWMYVGMCFSTFCWHNEDHWSYSINYLHWGEPKTWYGVPGFMAEKFEQVMRETTPDLFRNQPDLLHQLVTILNPNILMDQGIPVYHIDQAAGEFVLTFPRAYHAGFNHGYNFAEAVNFAPVDWIPLGRECVEHYSNLHRYCVFSHDELICKMASVPENLNSRLASATHQDMLEMLDIENKQRKALLEWGVVNAEREAFELLADDERKCSECNTTCFLSAVTCKCSSKKLTCLRHFKNHCMCAAIEHTLRYRYTLDELPVMLEKLKEKADSVAVWASKVHDALDINTPRTITLSGLKELLNEACEKHFPDDPSLKLLSKAIKSVQDALAVDFKNILSHKQTLSKKVTLMEIQSYYEELQRIPCTLPQENTVKHFLKFLEELEEAVEKLMLNNSPSLEEVDTLLKRGQFPNVEIPCLTKLEELRNVVEIIEDHKKMKKMSKPHSNLVDQLLNRCAAIKHPTNAINSIVKELTTLSESVNLWEKKAKIFSDRTICSNDSKPTLGQIEELIQELENLDVVPPSSESLVSVLQKVLKWREQIHNLLTQTEIFPFCEQFERALDEVRSLRIDLEEITQLKTVITEVVRWKEEVHDLFLGDCRVFGLLEVLTPRRNLPPKCKYNTIGVVSAPGSDSYDFLSADSNVKDDIDVEKIKASLQVAEKREFELLRALRVKNTYKRKQPDATFCLCNDSSTFSMKECILCKELFHIQCLKQLPNLWNNLEENVVFLCPFCQRTKRPEAKAVTISLKKLEQLRVQTLESVSMQCLLDREVKWKELVDDLLKTPEMLTISRAATDPKPRNTRSAHLTLSNENKGILETLLFRGFLLELDVPENKLIYKILHKLDREPINKVSTFDESTINIELINETCWLENELSSSCLMSSAKEKNNEFPLYMKNIGYDKSHTDDYQLFTLGKKKISSVTTMCRRKRKMPKTEDDLDQPENSKMNELLHNIETRKNKQKNIMNVEDEEENECEAKECLRPTGEHVDWVQCDFCKNWLHMICIGVTKGEVDDQTEFMCSLCKKVDGGNSTDDKNREDDDDDNDDDDRLLLMEYTNRNSPI